MKPLKILILEDDVLTGKNLKSILIEAGHEPPRVCNSLAEAKRAIDYENYDLAIMDILIDNRPDGIEFAKYVNQQMNIPFLFLTAHEDDELFKEANETKPSAYLIKPFHSKELNFQIQLAYSNSPKDEEHISTYKQFLFLPTSNGLKKVNKEKIVHILAKKASSEIYLEGQSLPERFSINLGFLEQFLDSSVFFRISRSSLINIHYMDEIIDGHMKMNGLLNSTPIKITQMSDFVKKINVSNY